MLGASPLAPGIDANSANFTVMTRANPSDVFGQATTIRFRRRFKPRTAAAKSTLAKRVWVRPVAEAPSTLCRRAIH
jgi:hypothetical protein